MGPAWPSGTRIEPPGPLTRPVSPAASWAALSAAYDETDCILAVMLVGYYHLVSQVLNALRVPIEDDVSG